MWCIIWMIMMMDGIELVVVNYLVNEFFGFFCWIE